LTYEPGIERTAEIEKPGLECVSMDEESQSDAALFPERVGDRLRTARIKAGLDLQDVATRTRVPLRHLTAIETGDYESLPSATYCAGFTKAYARAVGEDEVALSQMIREEMGQRPAEARYEPSMLDGAETGAVPSRKLAWTAAGLGLFVLAIYGISRVSTDGTADPLDTSIEAPVAVEAGTTNAVAPVVTAPASGEVVLIAKETVWARVYDANDKVLFEKEMVAGERYLVPADANNPQIRTGRADLITVTVGGKEVATLGPAERTVKDVGISAAALAARPPAAPLPTAVAPTLGNSATAPVVQP
jgi:cytoskeleton protein RodZ